MCKHEYVRRAESAEHDLTRHKALDKIARMKTVFESLYFLGMSSFPC